MRQHPLHMQWASNATLTPTEQALGMAGMRWLLGFIFASGVALAQQENAATIRMLSKNRWQLRNETLSFTLAFRNGSLEIESLKHEPNGSEALADKDAPPLFTHRIAGSDMKADDGQWKLDDVSVADIVGFEKNWGKRLELVMSRQAGKSLQTRQVFEIHGGDAGIRFVSHLKNLTARTMTIESSEVLHLNLPDRPHTLYHIDGVLNWQETQGGLSNGGRNALCHYDSGDGWYVLPENNWATSLEPGPNQGHSSEKLLGIDVWNKCRGMRVRTNPKAVQLVLFPGEQVEYFAVNFGLFQGDVTDGRLMAADHLRKRYKFWNPTRVLSVNDWQWGGLGGKRTDANYREIVIPKAAAAGFDRIHIDDFWYEPEDGTDPKGGWTDMPSLCSAIIDKGMKPGHWFSLQGRVCVNGWANGRDCADPANVDFKLKQMREVLISRYQTAWDQVDAGLLWKTPEVTPYSHPGDSVYRKVLGMRRYMNTISHEHPDFIMQTTCEVDNPAGPGSADSHGNQNIGLIHLADNGIAGMFRRTEYGDDVRDLFASVGMFPLEGLLSTWGEDGRADAAWKDSPLWYYQFLLARHTSIYSWPGNWSDASVKHLRIFNNWRKNPRFQSVLNELMRPVYNGADWKRNEGPWCWMYMDAVRSKALVFAIDHLELTQPEAFQARLKWLTRGKTYLAFQITQLPDGGFAYAFAGEHSGTELIETGLPVDLDAGPERCAAYWLQEKSGNQPQVLYADATVTSYQQQNSKVNLHGSPDSVANVFVFNPSTRSVDRFRVKTNAAGRATFDTASMPLVTGGKGESLCLPSSARFIKRDTTTAGRWRGRYGATAAWLAGQPSLPQNGYELSLRNATVHVWGEDDAAARVPELPGKTPGTKVAACWTAAETFELSVTPSVDTEPSPYQLTLYLMDYDNIQYPPRAMAVRLCDPSGKVLDRQNASRTETNGGLHLTWHVTGPATIMVRKTEGINAAASALFVDPVQP